MIRLLILPVLFLIPPAARTFPAKDYTLRIEMTVKRETSVGDNAPRRESEAQTLELMIAPDRRFCGRVTWGRETLSVKGKMTAVMDGEIKLDVEFSHTRRNGILGLEGRELKDTHSINTSIDVPIGEYLIIGGLESDGTSDTSEGTRRRKEGMLVRLKLTDGQPDE